MRQLFALSLYVATLGALVLLPITTLAKSAEIKQYISPLECAREVIDNGVAVEITLSPAECDELLNPKPPTEPEVAPPINTNASDNTPTGDVRTPNTGFFKQVTDYAVADRVPLIMLAVFTSWIVIVTKRRTRQAVVNSSSLRK